LKKKNERKKKLQLTNFVFSGW